MVWGFIIALVLVAGVCLLITSVSGKKPSVVSWIVALVLWVVLSFETNGLIRAIDGRSQIADLVSSIIGSISGYTDYVDMHSVISYQEANQIALGCKCVMPSYGKYFHASDFQGKTYGDIPTIVSTNIDNAMSRSVWNSIGWILLTLILGIVAMALFMGYGGRSSRRSGRSHVHGRPQRMGNRRRR